MTKNVWEIRISSLESGRDENNLIVLIMKEIVTALVMTRRNIN